MSRRVARCKHMMTEGRCTVFGCPHWDGGARNFRLGKPKQRQCRRCRRSIDVDQLDDKGFCRAQCETPSGRVGYGRTKPDPVKAFARELDEVKETG